MVFERIALSLLILIFSTQPVMAETAHERVMRTGEIRCGYFTWQPFLVKDPNTNEISGLSAEYIERIGDILDLKIIWKEEVGVGDYIAALNANRIDMMCMTLWPDAGRLKNSLLSKPIFFSGVYLNTTSARVLDFKSFDDVNKKEVRISAIEGDITETIVEKRFPDATVLRHAPISDLSAHLQSLISNKVDVIIQDLGVTQDQQKLGNDVVALKALGPVKIFPEMLGIKKGEIEFKLLIDNVIDVITAEGFVHDALKNSPSSSYPNILPYDLQTETR